MISEWLGNKRGPDFKCPLLREFGEGYLSFIEQDESLRPRTKKNAIMYTKELIEELGHMPLDEINEGVFEEWLVEFRQKKQRKTYVDYYAYLSKALRHAHSKGLINRMPDFKNPDGPRETGRVYTKAEVRAMIEHLERRLAWAEKIYERKHKIRTLRRAINALLQFRLSLNCIMRKREALLLSWDRFDLNRGVITLRAEDVKTGSRTGRGRTLFVDKDHVLPLFQRLHELRDDDNPWVFPSERDPSKPTWDNKSAWKNLKDEIELEDRGRWHDLRHTALTWALVGDDEFKAELERMTPEEQEKAKRERLMNPLLVGAYAGVDMRTITKVYLKIKEDHTREVASAIKI